MVARIVIVTVAVVPVVAVAVAAIAVAVALPLGAGLVLAIARSCTLAFALRIALSRRLQGRLLFVGGRTRGLALAANRTTGTNVGGSFLLLCFALGGGIDNSLRGIFGSECDCSAFGLH